MSFQMNAQVKRLEGRLVVYQGTLCLVVEVDESTGTARVSRGSEAGPEIFTMSTLDLRDAFSAGAELLLDGVQNPKTFARVKKVDDQWFFVSREGDQGPFESESDARDALNRYIVASQEAKARQTDAARSARIGGAERRTSHMAER